MEMYAMYHEVYGCGFIIYARIGCIAHGDSHFFMLVDVVVHFVDVA